MEITEDEFKTFEFLKNKIDQRIEEHGVTFSEGEKRHFNALKIKISRHVDQKIVFKKLAKIAEGNDPIDKSLYEKYDVKRGLRNANGTGVLVGLTSIGDVVGYEVNDGQKIAIPGRLVYRGYNVEALVKDAEEIGRAHV